MAFVRSGIMVKVPSSGNPAYDGWLLGWDEYDGWELGSDEGCEDDDGWELDEGSKDGWDEGAFDDLAVGTFVDLPHRDEGGFDDLAVGGTFVDLAPWDEGGFVDLAQLMAVLPSSGTNSSTPCP